MSITETENVTLEELLHGSPGCDAYHGDTPCRWPAAARIRLTCPRCGPVTLFLCSGCLRMLKNGRAICTQDARCRIPVIDWTLA